MSTEPTFEESVQLLINSVQASGITVGEAMRGLNKTRKEMQVRYLSGFLLTEDGKPNPLYGKELLITHDGNPLEIITAPDGLPISETEYKNIDIP